ncbi:MAG: class I SAM-dependent methyltransferase, partial [Rickettsiales bacterium]
AAPLFAQAAPRMAELLAGAEEFREDLLRIGPDTPPEPRWNQDWFPRLDALAAYVTVRSAAPARIIEVGAGHSTRFMARAIRDGGLSSRLTSIDPAPRALLDGLPGLDLLHAPLQDIDLVVFEALRPGDILFVDSSHVLAPGSDVERIFTEILPRAPSGLLVHFHDIFLPDGYPAAWAPRGYNEQSAVAALLTDGGYEIVFASAYAAKYLPAAVAGSVAAELPLVDGAVESSLWLRKR